MKITPQYRQDEGMTSSCLDTLDHHRNADSASEPFWQSFLSDPTLTPEQALYRDQAVNAQPCAIWLVVFAASSNTPKSRVEAARRIISTIDSAAPLLPVLSEFLGLTRSMLRSIRRLPLAAIKGMRSWKSALRVIRSLTLLGPLPDWMDDNWPMVQRCFPLLDVVADHTAITRRELLNDFRRIYGPDPARSIPENITPLFVVRNMDRLGGDVELFSRILERMERGIPEPKVVLELDDGWQAESLDTSDDLAWEGLRMRHCAHSFADQLESGQRQFFSLCSAQDGERVTVAIEPPLRHHPLPKAAFIEMAGFANRPFSIRALCVLSSLMEQLGARDINVTFTYPNDWQ